MYTDKLASCEFICVINIVNFFFSIDYRFWSERSTSTMNHTQCVYYRIDKDIADQEQLEYNNIYSMYAKTIQ